MAGPIQKAMSNLVGTASAMTVAGKKLSESEKQASVKASAEAKAKEEGAKAIQKEAQETALQADLVRMGADPESAQAFMNARALGLNTKSFGMIRKKGKFVGTYSSLAEKLSKDLELLDQNLSVSNLENSAQAERAMLLVISIFLYGFIGVITLIGVTNIFNTITSNMELRQKEFAMLKSIGMTKKEFNKMINLETLFYSSKSLCYGIILGLIGSYIIHLAFNKTTESSFAFPLTAICISIIFVFIIVYIIMKYSINKISKQNTIETIRNENI